jgi:predicted outer membrane repeat protein
VLCDGTWRVASTVHIAKNLTLRGAGAGQTILDGGRQPAGGGGVRVLEIAGAAVVVRDMTITNGNAQAGGLGNGGGIAVAANGTLTLQDSSVTNNVAAHDGGGIYVDSNGALTLEGGSVTGNVARYGGGIYSFYGTVDLEMSSSRGPFLSVTDNTATINGGGILSWESTVTSDGTASITHNAPNNCQPVAVVPYCAG